MTAPSDMHNHNLDNVKGRFSRRQFVLGLGGAGYLSALQTLPLKAQPPGRLKALVIGINEYSSLKDLDRAVIDANSVKTELSNMGYDVLYGENLDTDGFFSLYNEYLDNLSEYDAAFVYFAGHGLQYNGVNFLVPSDANGSDGDNLVASSFSLPSLLDEIANRKPRQSIAIIDACRNEPLNISVEGITDGFTSTTAPGGFFVAYSAGTGQFAIDHLGEDDCHKNGLFTRNLIDNLKPDRPISDIIKLTRSDVAKAASSIGRKQNPAYYDQSRFEYRLDGQESSDEISKLSLGGLDGTMALIVAVEDYASFSSEISLQTPKKDGMRIAKMLSDMGAETIFLSEPSKSELQIVCQNIRARKNRQILVYLAGHGLLYGDDAHLILPSKPVNGTKHKMAVTVDQSNKTLQLPKGLEALSAIELATWLSDDLVTEEAKKTPLLVFYDSDLSVIANIVMESPSSSLLSTGSRAEFDHVAFLAATSLRQHAADSAGEKNSSPFAIAMLNSFGRPGLTIRQYMDQIRSEVENLTDMQQTPRLFLGRALKNFIPVLEQSTKRKSEKCS